MLPISPDGNMSHSKATLTTAATQRGMLHRHANGKVPTYWWTLLKLWQSYSSLLLEVWKRERLMEEDTLKIQLRRKGKDRRGQTDGQTDRQVHQYRPQNNVAQQTCIHRASYTCVTFNQTRQESSEDQSKRKHYQDKRQIKH